MTAEESVRAGRLDEALADLQAQVRKQPAEPRLRIFLFQLLSVLGQWDRALTQLKVAADLDASAATMMATYKEVLRCEMLRARGLRRARRTPLLFGKPAEWMALLVAGAAARPPSRSSTRRPSCASAPSKSAPDDRGQRSTTSPSSGSPTPISASARCSRRSSTAATTGFRSRACREVRIEKPADLRDIAWTPACLTLANGGETVALIPTRYPGSETRAQPGAGHGARDRVDRGPGRDLPRSRPAPARDRTRASTRSWTFARSRSTPPTTATPPQPAPERRRGVADGRADPEGAATAVAARSPDRRQPERAARVARQARALARRACASACGAI